MIRIRAVRCNHASFKEVHFTPGFNVILADRTEVSGSRDSRNGLGKSTLIEIIHFCLGASLQRGKGLGVVQLKGWSFSLELTLANRVVIVTRNTEEPSKILIIGDTTDWPIQPKVKEGQKILSLKDWTTVLGSLMFGLPISDEDKKYQPSFRSLISYFIRRGRDAFSTPFEHYRKQLEWDKQVNNAFLLGLAWEDARDLQLLKDRQKLLEDFKKLKKDTETGVVIGVLGSLGELEALKVQVESQLRERKETLSNFRVAPQYHELEQQANRLTAEIHEATNKNITDQKLLEFYELSLESENEPSPDAVVSIYERAGVELPGLVVRRLEEVEVFHRQLIENRRNFLAAEIQRLRRDISARESLLREKIEERASLLEILQTHGALEEFTRLQELYLDTVADLNEINKRIEELKKFEEAKSSLKIEKERLLQRARRDKEERSVQVERAMSFFHENSRFLYDAPGSLSINVGDNGFQFRVDIRRDGSEGIGNMKIFCYDLMLAQLWSEHDPSPRLLIHDSTIFDGVDERQVALALELADRVSSNCGFQYICTFNSDMIPRSEFSQDFEKNFDSFVRLRLTDDTDEGGLLGIRF
ncbi:ABC-three component system protein [Floridanema aerugineum]|uniref:ABC-three component system protein n=1 Tax=Floridaenema aerugineum BLCC-F46 TaxID=3153654 RepID=A0ABV4XCL3_9CYAN